MCIRDRLGSGIWQYRTLPIIRTSRNRIFHPVFCRHCAPVPWAGPAQPEALQRMYLAKAHTVLSESAASTPPVSYTHLVEQKLEEIAYKALPEALVETVEVDLSGLKPGDVVKVKDLAIAADKDVVLATDPDACLLYTSRCV